MAGDVSKRTKKEGRWGTRGPRPEWSRNWKKKAFQGGGNSICAITECNSWKYSYFVRTLGQEQQSSQVTYILSFKVMKWNWRTVQKIAFWQLSNFSLVPISWTFKNHKLFCLTVGKQTRWENPEGFTESPKEKTRWFGCIKAGWVDERKVLLVILWSWKYFTQADILVLIVTHTMAVKGSFGDFLWLNCVNKSWSLEEVEKGKGKMEISKFQAVSGKTWDHFLLVIFPSGRFLLLLHFD